MAETKFIRGSAPNDPLAPPLVLPSYDYKRGKIHATPRAAWGAKDAHGKPFDPELGRRLLDDAEK